MVEVGNPDSPIPTWLRRLKAITEAEMIATTKIYCWYHPTALLREDMADILWRCLEARHGLEGKGIVGAAEELADFSPSRLQGALRKFFPVSNMAYHNDTSSRPSSNDP